MERLELLEKYLNGQCSREEINLLYQQLQQGKYQDYEHLLDRIMQELQEGEPLPHEKSNELFEHISLRIKDSQLQMTRTIVHWKYISIAASLLVLLLSGIYFFTLPDTLHVTTAYQETRQVLLPDGTEVMLNANSKLIYAENLAEQQTREVWIEGEAYFHVNPRSTSTHEKVPFTVHTQLVDIAVLGTSFNVKDRHGKAEIVLNEGKIRLSHKQGSKQKKLDMQPGQKVLVDRLNGLSLSEVDDPGLYSSWKENELYFDDESLAAIAVELQDEYGISISFEDEKIGELQFTGSAPADDLKVLFISMEKSFNLNIQKNNDQYHISRP